MSRVHLNTTLLFVFATGSLVACVSRGPVPTPTVLRSQPDTGQVVDYLQFAGISYGDTFDEVVSLFGEPTSIDLNEGEYDFASAYYVIQGKECLDVGYDKATRRVETIHVSCERVRDILLSRQVDDPKLALFGQHRDSVLKKYGAPASVSSDRYQYEFESEGGRDGQVDFTCYDFDDYNCEFVNVHWFYPVSEAELLETLEGLRQEFDETSTRLRVKVRQLFELMKVVEQSKQVMNAVLSAMKPKVPDEVWADLLAEIDFDELIELMASIYEKHLTEQEIDDLIVFYSSPTGRSFIEKQSLILKESMAAGQEWGKSQAQRLREKLEAKKKTIGP